MRIAVYGLIGLVCTLIAGATFVYFAVPTGYVRDRAIAEVKQRTGRTLTVAGGASFTVYPRLGVELENVALSGPPGMESETFVQMERLTLAIPLWPLMKRELAVDELVLVRPVIQLAVDAQGRRTWDFTPPARGSAQEVAPIEPGDIGQDGEASSTTTVATSEPTQKKRSAGLAGLSLGDVRIEEGEVRYANLLTKSTERLTNVNVQLALTQIDAPFEATGSVVWHKKALPFSARLETLKSFIESSPAHLVLALDAEHVDASYDGTLDLASAALLDGAMTLATPSLRELAAWTGAKLPPVGGLGPLDLKSNVRVAGATTALSKATLTLDGAKATGDLSLDRGGERPLIKGNIAIDTLNLNTYLAEDGAGAMVAAKTTGKKKPKTDDTASEAAEIDETASIEAAPAAKPKKKRASGSGWSTEPIDVRGLSVIDADMTIASGGLLYKDIKIGKSQIVLTLTGGLLKARLPQLQAYGGKGVGAVQLDGTAAVPKLQANVTVNGVAARPLLTDAMALDWIEGTGSLSFGLMSEGKSEKALIGGLNGQSRFAFTDGAIVGMNIPQMVRGLGKGKVSGLKRDDSLKTDFSELSGTVSITSGIATNKDLSVVGPLIRIAGAGTVDLPAQQLDYAVMPKIVASLEGQGGTDATGVTIPVRIDGPWAKPRITPDFAALAKDPEAIANTVKELGGKLKDSDKKKINKTLEKLTGKSGANVDDLVGGILGQ